MERIKLKCRNCKCPTNHQVESEIVKTGHYADRKGVPFSLVEKFRIVTCLGCEIPSFHLFVMGYGQDEDDSHQILDAIYPNLLNERGLAFRIGTLPKKIESIYLETLKAHSAEIPTLTAIGLRAVVEAVCIDQRCTAGNLQQKIAELVTLGALTQPQVDFLHLHRFIGNDAAHEQAPPPKREIEGALDIIENLLKALYELPKTAASVRNSRKRRGRRV